MRPLVPHGIRPHNHMPALRYPSKTCQPHGTPTIAGPQAGVVTWGRWGPCRLCGSGPFLEGAVGAAPPAPLGTPLQSRHRRRRPSPCTHHAGCKHATPDASTSIKPMAKVEHGRAGVPFPSGCVAGLPTTDPPTQPPTTTHTHTTPRTPRPTTVGIVHSRACKAAVLARVHKRSPTCRCPTGSQCPPPWRSRRRHRPHRLRQSWTRDGPRGDQTWAPWPGPPAPAPSSSCWPALR
jgi:hypothetical protein